VRQRESRPSPAIVASPSHPDPGSAQCPTRPPPPFGLLPTLGRAEVPGRASWTTCGVRCRPTAIPHSGSVAMSLMDRNAPSSSHNTRSATSVTRASWPTITTPRASSVAILRWSRAISRRSSSRGWPSARRRGSPPDRSRARAIGTRCFSPPGSLWGGKPNRTPSPKSRGSASAHPRARPVTWARLSASRFQREGDLTAHGGPPGDRRALRRRNA
jgi:hypothetical protein